MLQDMKLNLLGNLSSEDSTQASFTPSTPLTSTPSLSPSEETKSPSPVTPLADVSQEEDREDFSLEETEQAQEVAAPEVEAQMKSCTFGGDIAEVMQQEESKYIGEKIDEDLEKYNTFERIKEYLQEEIGKEVLDKAHPVLKEFGDDILYEKNIPKVVERLEGIVGENEVVKYLHFFATLIFFENQKEVIKEKLVVRCYF